MKFPSSTISLNNTEQALFSTFKIEVQTLDKNIQATAFFASFRLPNGNNAVVLISSRHVLQDAQSLRLWVPIEKAHGRLPECFANITVKLNGEITCHPDPDVDLAGIIIHHIEKQVLPEDEKLFYRAISEQNIPTLDQWSDISVGDDVFVIGCPFGVEDERTRRPIVRKGIIASLSKELERPHMLIDVPTFEGASGSPVIVDAHFGFDRIKGEYEFRSRFYLVGVVSDGLEVRDEGDDGKKDEFLADLHLGKVVRSDKIPELFQAILDQYKIK
jgi:hypothetical protein